MPDSPDPVELNPVECLDDIEGLRRAAAKLHDAYERVRQKNHAMATERDKAKSDLVAAGERHAAIMAGRNEGLRRYRDEMAEMTERARVAEAALLLCQQELDTLRGDAAYFDKTMVEAEARADASTSALTALQQRLDAVYGALREIAKGYVDSRQGMTPAAYAQSFLDLHVKIYGADTLASLLPPASQDE